MSYCKSHTKFISLTRDQIYKKTSHAVNMQGYMINLLKAYQKDEQASSGPSAHNSKEKPNDAEHESQAPNSQASSKDSTTYRDLFPENKEKSQLVRGLYKRAATREQREELDQMVNEEKYFDLKRQKKGQFERW